MRSRSVLIAGVCAVVAGCFPERATGVRRVSPVLFMTCAGLPECPFRPGQGPLVLLNGELTDSATMVRHARDLYFVLSVKPGHPEIARFGALARNGAVMIYTRPGEGARRAAGEAEMRARMRAESGAAP